jgi:hypothetical protein
MSSEIARRSMSENVQAEMKLHRVKHGRQPTKDEAQRIAASIVKLPELLKGQ